MEQDQPDCPKAVNCLKTARGQMDGIIKMLDGKRDCVDVSKQILAAIALLKKANSALLKGHFEERLGAAVRSGCQDEVLTDLMKTLDSYLDN